MPSSFNPQSCQEMKFLPLYHASGRIIDVHVCVCVCSRDACEILELTSYFMKGNLATMWVSLLSKPYCGPLISKKAMGTHQAM